MSTKVNQVSAKLIKQLRQKDKLAFKLNRNCDILTALLQAKSLKRSKHIFTLLKRLFFDLRELDLSI
jgi:hypothetical protein